MATSAPALARPSALTVQHAAAADDSGRLSAQIEQILRGSHPPGYIRTLRSFTKLPPFPCPASALTRMKHWSNFLATGIDRASGS
jgi:hypothetical protein